MIAPEQTSVGAAATAPPTHTPRATTVEEAEAWARCPDAKTATCAHWRQHLLLLFRLLQRRLLLLQLHPLLLLQLPVLQLLLLQLHSHLLCQPLLQQPMRLQLHHLPQLLLRQLLWQIQLRLRLHLKSLQVG